MYIRLPRDLNNVGDYSYNYDYGYYGSGKNVPFWYSTTGYIVKYSIIGAIFLFFILFILGGYLHAQRRMKKGLPPLAYHRWLVSRRQRAQYDPRHQNQFTFYRADPYHVNRPQGDGYSMQNYPEPPPMYNNDVPPGYQPPPGATKTNPQQNSYEAPPPGNPPTHDGQQNNVSSFDQDLPARPQPVQTRIKNLVSSLRRP